MHKVLSAILKTIVLLLFGWAVLFLVRLLMSFFEVNSIFWLALQGIVAVLLGLFLSYILRKRGLTSSRKKLPEIAPYFITYAVVTVFTFFAYVNGIINWPLISDFVESISATLSPDTHRFSILMAISLCDLTMHIFVTIMCLVMLFSIYIRSKLGRTNLSFKPSSAQSQ